MRRGASTLDQFADETMMVQSAYILQLVVNSSGTAVMVGGSDSNLIAIAYRPTATGSFAFSVRPGEIGLGDATGSPFVALNDNGAAAALVYRDGDTLLSTMLSAGAPAFGPMEVVDPDIASVGWMPRDLTVGIDGAGNVLAAFTLREPTGTDRGTRRPGARPAAAGRCSGLSARSVPPSVSSRQTRASS